MKLEYIQIDIFKNLRSFEFDFNKQNTQLVTVILGRNGSGKSNLLEALVIIFRDLYLGRESDFGYELHYILEKGTHHVTVINRPVKTGKERFSFHVKSNDVIVSVSRSELKEGAGHRWLPRHVFAYYSGPSDRLEQHFREHQRRFYRDLLDGVAKPFRPLFYARPVHSQFVLLAFFTSDDEKPREFLRDQLGITDLDSALFVLRKPHWAASQLKQATGDARFWGARGVVSGFLDRLYKEALAPMRLEGRTDPAGHEKPRAIERLFLYLCDKTALQKLARLDDNAADFFKELESTYISDLIEQLRIRVQVKNCDGSLTFRELSEGEQQLLTVVGLLRFTKETDSLFLLDEPDTHLNPAWGIKYLEILSKIAEPGSDSQVLMATHDPLVLSDLKRNQVIVMERNSETGIVQAFQPEIDPIGLGVDGILRSELFGLPTTVGAKVEKKLLERDKLLAKADKLSAKDKEKMRKLSDELASMGFATEFRDPKFELFIKALARRRENEKPSLSSADIKRQEKLADDILEELSKSEEA